jgi:hypothetical protein
VRTLSVADFIKTAWLHAVGAPVDGATDSLGSLAEIRARLEQSPDDFFAPPYSSPYEDWCVGDHEAAAEIAKAHAAEIQGASKRAYLAAWQVFPHPEICGLVSDDVSTIHALLLAPGSPPLSAFTNERATWLMRGRVPWGYRGDFPSGRWLVL